MPEPRVPTLPGLSDAARLLGERAVARMESWIGRHEEGGKNRGRLVLELCRRWTSPARFREIYDAGKCEWCAGAVCSAFDDAGSEVLRPGARPRIGSLHVPTFWKLAQGAASKRPDLVEVWRTEGDWLSRVRRGDILLSDSNQDGVPGHMGIVKEPGDVIITVAGNAGPDVDRIAYQRYPVDGGKVFAFVRVLR